MIKNEVDCTVCNVTIDNIFNSIFRKNNRYYCNDCVDFSDVKGFNYLDHDLKNIFINTYSKHYKSHGTKNRKKFTIDNIKEIKVNYKEMCIEVYFNHEWFKYFPNLTWG